MEGVWIRPAAQDVAHGFRVLRRRPSLLVSAVVVLGLTAGAMISLVVLIDRLMLKPVSVEHPARLVQVVRLAAPGGFRDESFPGELTGPLREAVSRLGTLLTVDYPWDESLSYSLHEFEPERVRTQSVDAAAFAALGIQSFVGRVFDGSDAQRGSEAVAVLSYEHWKKRFQGAPDVLGRGLRLHDQSFRIVGVLEPGFSELDIGTAPDVWFPIPADEGGRVLVALDPDVTPPQLEAAMAPALEQFLKQQPPDEARRGNERYLARKLAVVDASTGMSATGTRELFARPLLTLAIAGAVLLGIGCANVSLLLFALHASRRAEMAVRVSLGASAGRLMRQMVAETSILAVTGCVLGCGIAPAITSAFVRLASDPDVPTRIEWQWDWRVAAVVGLFCIAVTALCAAAPALRVAREQPMPSIRGRYSFRIATRRRFRLEDLLIAGQTSLALVLLVGAGLLQATWRNLDRLDPGFAKDRLLIADLQWEHEGERAYTNSVYRTLLERVAALPAVSRVSVSGWSYFGNNSRLWSIVPEGGDDAGDQPLCEFLSVGPGFFRTMGTELLRGRDFTTSDTEGSPLVAVLSESAMRLYFGGVDAVGGHFSAFDRNQQIEIVGAVADARLNSLRDAAPPMVYLPFFQSEARGTSSTPASLEIRLAPGRELGAGELQRILRAAAAGLAARQILPQDALVERSLSRERLLSAVSVSLGLVAALLAGVGLAGAVAQAVASRTREFGIRLALGARHGDLIAGSVRRALSPVAGGVAIGVPLTFAVSGFLRSVLFGVEPFDPWVVSGSVALLFAITAGAAWVPSLRSTRIEAAAALRED